MKRLRSLSLQTLILCLCGTSSLYAQAPTPPEASGEFRVGISAGATVNYHSGSPYGTESDPQAWMFIEDCPFTFVDENPIGFSAGVVAEYEFGSRFGLASHILYSTHPRVGVDELPDAQVLVPGDPPQIVTQSEEWKVAIAYDMIGFDLLGKSRILSTDVIGFGVAIGFAVGHVERLEQTATAHIIGAENARYVQPATPAIEMRDSGRTLVFLEDAPIEKTSSTRFSMRSGLFFEVDLLDRFHITPGAYFDYGLTPVVKESEWMLNYAMFQLDVTARL